VTAVLQRVPPPGSEIDCRAAGHVKDEVPVFSKGLQQVFRRLCHGGDPLITARRPRISLFTKGKEKFSLFQARNAPHLTVCAIAVRLFQPTQAIDEMMFSPFSCISIYHCHRSTLFGLYCDARASIYSRVSPRARST